MNIINCLILSNEMIAMIIASAIMLIILIIAVIKINSTHKKNIKEFYNKDILTNKYNYQGFINQLEKINRVKRWTVICFDIDSFKQVNKNHDYEFGDEVLKLVASVVDEILDDNGIVGRIESNRYLVGFPSDYKNVDNIINDIENRISTLEYKRFKFNFETTIGCYNGSQNDEVKEVVSLAIEDWLKNKKQKEEQKLATIEAASKEEIAKLADDAKLRQEDSNQKLELVIKTKEEVSLIEIETARKLEESNRNIEIANEKMALSQAQLQEVIKLKGEADAKFLEAKNLELEAQSQKAQAKIQLDEALRIKTEAEALKAEALRIKEEAERNKHDVEREQYEARRTKEDAQRLQDEAKRAKEDADRERQNAYDMKRQAYEDSRYQRRDSYRDDYYDSRRYHNNPRDYDYNNISDKDPRIIINTQQDAITERRVEEIINSVLSREKSRNNDNNNDSSSRLNQDDIELMVRRIVMDSMKQQDKQESNKEVKQLEYKDYSKKETDKLSSDELEAAIRNVMGEYMTSKESENQTKKEKAHEEEEKEKLTDLLTRLIDIQEKAQQEKEKEVIVINHPQNDAKEESKVDVIHPTVEPDIIYSDVDDEDDEDEDDEDEQIPQEFIDQLDSKLDIKQFQALMDEYMQKYNQHDSSEVQVSGENAKTLPFIERVNLSSRDNKTYYNMIKNAIMERDGILNLITNRYDTFKVGRKVLFKIAYVGKTLKLYLPLDPNIYPNGQYPHKDVSNKKKHINTPYMMKIKSNLGLKRALVLIEDSMIKLNLEKKSDYKNADYVARNRNLIMKKANQ